jgi:hypothetical protein
VAERRFAAKMIFMSAGMLIWAAHFTAVYVFNALACARHFADATVSGFAIVPATVTAATVFALGATGWVLFQALAWRGPVVGESAEDPTAGFIRYTTIVVALLSVVAIVWNGVPAFIVPPCG